MVVEQFDDSVKTTLGEALFDHDDNLAELSFAWVSLHASILFLNLHLLFELE